MEELVGMLSEENSLLKDFAYNIDPSAKTLHEQKFMPDDESSHYEKSLIEKINEYANRSYLFEKKEVNLAPKV